MGGFFVSVVELNRLVGADSPPAVIDVRKRAAFEADTAMLPTARWRDHAQVDLWMAELDPAEPVVLYCVHGHEVSQGAAAELRRHGYDARVLTGGIEAWREAGATLVTRPEPGPGYAE